MIEYAVIWECEMTGFFEEKRKAGKYHLCDYCCNQIEPGQTYTRKFFTDKNGILILKEHSEPSCPPNIFEDEMSRDSKEVAVVVMHAVTSRLVLKILADGKTITISEPCIETRLVSEYDTPSINSDSDDEIPF